MDYRNFGELGFSVSAFGFGAMRLPILDNNQSKINEAEAIKMIRHAIDNGVNYFDTAYVYHGGNSEVVLGKALEGGYREKIILTSKLPTWSVNSEADVTRLLDEQLERLGVEYLDFYLVHAINRSYFDKMKNIDILGEMEKAVERGKIKYIGFSFHDDLEIFKEVVDYYDWKMCQIQFNILDEDYQAGLEGLKYAGSKKIPVVIMEPIRGGVLAKNVPDEVLELYNNYKTKLSPVEWAFKFVADFKEVVTVLSGVSDMEQLQDNIRIFQDTAPESLSKEDFELIDKVKQVYSSKIKVGCTACNYCLPCPSGVEIPSIFRAYNYSEFDHEKFVSEYKHYKSIGKAKCVECGACESACPQHIPIIEKLKDVAVAAK